MGVSHITTPGNCIHATQSCSNVHHSQEIGVNGATGCCAKKSWLKFCLTCAYHLKLILTFLCRSTPFLILLPTSFLAFASHMTKCVHQKAVSFHLEAQVSRPKRTSVSQFSFQSAREGFQLAQFEFRTNLWTNQL